MELSQETVLRVLLAHRTSLLGYIRSLVRDGHVAEDVFQEVSVLALEKRAELVDEEALPAWLRKTARYRVLAHFRNTQRTPPMLSTATMDLMDQSWETTDTRTSGDLMIVLRSCLGKLGPRTQRLLSLRYTDGLGGAEVAEIVGRNVGAVYTALSRAHQRLRDCMQTRLSGEGESV